MRIGKQVIKTAIGIFDDVVHTSGVKSANKIEIPIARASKATGMGISIERTITLKTPEFPNLSRYYSNKLSEIYRTNPERYQQMKESGLFQLIEEGKVSEKIFENIGENKYFTENFLKDIKKVYQEKPLITEIPNRTDLKDIGKFVEEGEVGVINGKLYANQNGNAVELQLSKEKFEELFPLMERFKIEQGQIGDCWLISGIDNFMGNPSQRVELYKLMRQQGNDILIKYPNSRNELRFVNSEVYNSHGDLCSGAKGVKMFEQSFIFHRKKLFTPNMPDTDVIARLREQPNLVNKLNGGVQGEFTDAVYGNDRLDWTGWKRFFKYILNSAKYDLMTSSKNKTTAEELRRWTKDKPYLVTYSCDHSGIATHYREGLVNPEYDLFAPHAYSLKDYNTFNRKATLSNPHHTEVFIDAPLDVLEDYGHFTHIGLKV